MFLRRFATCQTAAWLNAISQKAALDFGADMGIRKKRGNQPSAIEAKTLEVARSILPRRCALGRVTENHNSGFNLGRISTDTTGNWRFGKFKS